MKSESGASRGADDRDLQDKIEEAKNRARTAEASNYIVLMKAQTWDRESHGLYDYESRRVQKLELKVEEEGFMVRDQEVVSFDTTSEDCKFDDKTTLFRLTKKKDKFYVCPMNDNHPNDRLWLVIRSLKDGYIIKRHDILKLGRMKFKVKEFRTEKEYFEGEHIEVSPHKGFEEIHEVSGVDNEDIMCRFCWTGDQTEANPLIGSCKCDGSIKYIHFNCLKLWLESKVSK